MKKLLLSITLGLYLPSVYAAELAPETTATAPLSANLTLASQYVSRGFQQTWGKPALQGGLDYSHPSGVFAGTWASTVSDHFIRDATIEWDVYTGYYHDLGNLSLGVTAAYYYYPGAKTTAKTGHTRFNYGEIIPEIGYGPLTVKYAVTYTRDYFGNNADTLGTDTPQHSRGSAYLDINWDQPITEDWSVNAHYGHQRIKNFSAANFQDISVAVNKELPHNFIASLIYSKAWDKDNYYKTYSNGNPNARGSNPIDATATLSITKNF